MTREEFEKYLEKKRKAKPDSFSWVVDNHVCGAAVYDDEKIDVIVISGYADNARIIDFAISNAKKIGRKIVKFENYYYGRLVSVISLRYIGDNYEWSKEKSTDR